MALCNITGLVYLPNGALARSRTITFSRVDKSVRAEYFGAVVPVDVITKTNGAGEVDVNLLPGRYVMSTGTYSGGAIVPDADTADISDILTIVTPDIPVPAWLQQALASRDTAVDAADRADAAADRAVSAAEEMDAVSDAVDAIAPNVRKLNTEATRAPLPTDDETKGYASGSRWLWQGQEWVFDTVNGWLNPSQLISGSLTSYAAASSVAKMPYQGRVSARIGGRLVEWVRDAAGTALGGGWSPAGDVNAEHFGVDDDPAVSALAAVTAARDYAVAADRPLMLGPRLYDLGDGFLDVSGLTVKGYYRGYRNANGSRLKSTGTAIKQVSATAASTAPQIENVRLESGGAAVAADFTYLLFSEIRSVDIFTSGEGILLGKPGAAGSLWPKFRSVSVWASGGTCLTLTGKEWVNQVSFEDCWFSQTDPNGHCVVIKTESGLGAISNTFTRCEFAGAGSAFLLADGSAGAKDLVLIQPYFEQYGPAIRSVNGTNHVTVIGGTFAGRKNTVRGAEAWFHHEGTGSLRASLVSPYVYLPSGAETAGLRMFSKNGTGIIYPSVSGTPRFDANPVGFRAEYQYVPEVGAVGFVLGSGSLVSWANIIGRRITISFRLVSAADTVWGTGLLTLISGFPRADDVDAVGFGNVSMPGLGNRSLQVMSGTSGQIYFRVHDSGSVFWTDLTAGGPVLTGAPAGTVLHGSISYAI